MLQISKNSSRQLARKIETRDLGCVGPTITVKFVGRLVKDSVLSLDNSNGTGFA